MSSENEAAAIVRGYYDEVFAGRNLAALDQVIAPDFVGHAAGYGDFTIDGMRRAIERELATTPVDETIVEEQLVVGDRVVSRWRYRWRHDQSLFGERPTGNWLTMDGVHIDRSANGTIAERWELKDFWGVVRHLGGRVTRVGGRRECSVLRSSTPAHCPLPTGLSMIVPSA